MFRNVPRLVVVALVAALGLSAWAQENARQGKQPSGKKTSEQLKKLEELKRQAQQDKPGEKKRPGELSYEEMMAKWAELNALGPEHERFKKMVGTWDTKMLMWMGPGTEPVESKGVAEFRLVFDGRYVEQRFKCSWNGEPFEGLGYDGYDRIKKKYVSVWMDSTSTGIFYAEGTADESGKVFTYLGKMDDPFTGQKDKIAKSVARQIDDDHVIFEMYDTLPDGSEFKTMEIHYSRRK